MHQYTNLRLSLRHYLMIFGLVLAGSGLLLLKGTADRAKSERDALARSEEQQLRFSIELMQSSMTEMVRRASLQAAAGGSALKEPGVLSTFRFVQSGNGLVLEGSSPDTANTANAANAKGSAPVANAPVAAENTATNSNASDAEQLQPVAQSMLENGETRRTLFLSRGPAEPQMLGVLFNSQAQLNAQNPNARIDVAVIDPMAAFGAMTSTFKDAGKMRAYWVLPNGKVVAFSQDADPRQSIDGALDLADHRRTEMLQDTQGAPFARTAAKWDEMPGLLAIERPVSDPNALVAARARPSVSDVARTLGFAVVCVVLLAMFDYRRSRGLIAELEKDLADQFSMPMSKLANGQAAHASLKSQTLGQALTQMTQASQAKTQEAKNQNLSREQLILQRYKAEAPSSPSRQSLHSRLTQAMAQVNQAPVLFFSVEPQTRIATLTHEAGFADNESKWMGKSNYSFVMKPETMGEIHAHELKGKWNSLSGLPELAQCLGTKVPGARFEAWPVTTFNGNSKTPSRVTGVLVLMARDGETAESRAQLRPYLGQALRMTGKAYEKPELQA